MQRRRSGTRNALLISLILHLVVLLTLRDAIFYERADKGFGTVHVDLLDLPSSAVKSPPPIPRRTVEPIKRTRISPAEGSPSRFAFDKPSPRQTVAKSTDENVPEADIPMVDTSVLARSSLPGRLSSTTSAAGASSRGRGTGERSGRGRGGQGGLASVSLRRIPVKDDAVSEKFQVYNEADLPFVKALQDIAQHVLSVKNSRKVDIVFVVDTSGSMQDNINAVERHLSKMIDRFQMANLDFTLGVVRFHHSVVYEWLGMDITISPQTSNVDEIRRALRSIKVSGGERALDALMKAISKVEFRSGADRHFILVTDEFVKGTYPVSEVLRAAKSAKITIDVLGRDEPFQKTIAEQTGGLWTPIENVQ